MFVTSFPSFYYRKNTQIGRFRLVILLKICYLLKNTTAGSPVEREREKNEHHETDPADRPLRADHDAGLL